MVVVDPPAGAGSGGGGDQCRCRVHKPAWCICIARPDDRQSSAKHVQVYTAGGGAKNAKWMAMRAAKLGVPVEASPQAEAAYGAALLARQGWRQREAQQA